MSNGERGCVEEHAICQCAEVLYPLSSAKKQGQSGDVATALRLTWYRRDGVELERISRHPAAERRQCEVPSPTELNPLERFQMKNARARQCAKI